MAESKISKPVWSIILIVGLLFIAFSLYRLLFSFVLTINGDKIPAEEFRIYMMRERATVLSEVQQDTILLSEKDVYQLIFQKAMQQLVLNKVQWQKSKSLGLSFQDNLTGIGERIDISGCNYSFF
ncbi:MAG: hypothetical protein HC830_05465 [Bacteroidetes bacterium]|nr:hypothetical protein [Bacteroidota bacterium]